MAIVDPLTGRIPTPHPILLVVFGNNVLWVLNLLTETVHHWGVLMRKMNLRESVALLAFKRARPLLQGELGTRVTNPSTHIGNGEVRAFVEGLGSAGVGQHGSLFTITEGRVCVD